MAVNGIAPPRGISERLLSTGGRLPFEQVDTNRNGSVNLQELTHGVRLNFPGLTDLECSAIAQKAFDSAAKGNRVDARSWAVAEPIVLAEAALTLSDKARDASVVPLPSAWGAPGDELRAPPSSFMDGPGPYLPGFQQQLPGAYQPQMPGQYPQTNWNVQPPPYQAPLWNGQLPMDPAQEKMRAAGRTGVGLLKMIPGVGNILNGIDFVRDIGKAIGAWFNPNKSFGEKMKASADLLFHGAGMIAPQLGGMYDVAQGLVRMGTADSRARMQTLPPFQFNSGGYPPLSPMQGYSPAGLQPQLYPQQPLGYPQPQLAYPQQPQFYPQQPVLPQPYQQWQYGNGQQFMPQATPGEKAVRATGRIGLGALKMVPVLGNFLNGLDFLKDLGKVATGWLNPFKPTSEKLKAGADLLFHGIGMIAPQVGGAYDLLQGSARLGSAAVESVRGPLSQLPPYRFDPGPYPPLYPMQFNPGF